MPFTFCTNCGKQIDESLEKCPYCGHIKGSENYTYGDAAEPEKKPQNTSSDGNNRNGQPSNDPYGNNNPYGQQGNDPYGNNNPYGQPGNNPYGNNNPYGQGQHPNWIPNVNMYRPVPDRPLSSGLLIFSIINIVFGCCCTVGFIFGIIALMFTLNARQAPTDNEEIRRKKIALAMNITAVVLTVAMFISFVVAFAGQL